MAALSIGNVGAYKFAYDRYMKDRREKEELSCPEQIEETVWVKKRYIPTDLRHTAPVPRHKLMAIGSLPSTDRHWIPVGEPPLRGFCRDDEERTIFASNPSTRCEHWSTLRQVLPSTGSSFKKNPSNWGTGNNLPPVMFARPFKRHPKVNSPMTRYVDDMHLTNRLFKLH